MPTTFKPLRVLLPALLLMSVMGNADAAPEKIKVLLVTGFDVGGHYWEESTQLVQAILRKTGRFDISSNMKTSRVLKVFDTWDFADAREGCN